MNKTTVLFIALSSIQPRKGMILAAVWKNLESMTLSERNQTLKPHIE